MYHSVKNQYRTNKKFENCLMKNKITSGFLTTSPGYQCYKRLFCCCCCLSDATEKKPYQTIKPGTIKPLPSQNQPIEIYYQPTFFPQKVSLLFFEAHLVTICYIFFCLFYTMISYVCLALS